ncbi:hypothetical protein ACFVH6_23850 [Spirillospora sp. NPDC127200]
MAAAVLAALVLTGCGGSDEKGGDVASAGGKSPSGGAASSSVAAPIDPNDQMLQFVRCLRQNGVNVADPKPGEDIGKLGFPPGTDRGTVERAQQACRQYAPQNSAGRRSDPKVRDQLVKFAACMRGAGVNVADPPVNGPVDMSGVDRKSPQYAKAMEKCSGLLPEQGTP